MNNLSALISQQIPAMQMAVGGATPQERQRRAERMARIALTALRKDSKLAQCTPESFLGSLMICAQLDLEPNTPQGLAHLIAYENRAKKVLECQFQPGYPGLMELAYRSGKVNYFHADIVYRKEVESGLFTYTKGLRPNIRHDVDILGDCREGEIVAAYAVAEVVNGSVVFRVIDRNDAERAKKSSPSLRGGRAEYSAWNTNPDAMWMKTAIKRLCSFLPKTEHLSMALELDDKAERGESQLVAEVSKNIELQDALMVDSQEVAEVRCPNTGKPVSPESCEGRSCRNGCPEFPKRDGE